MTKYTTFVSVINNRKMHMKLLVSKNFERSAGDFPVDCTGCYMYFYEIVM